MPKCETPLCNDNIKELQKESKNAKKSRHDLRERVSVLQAQFEDSQTNMNKTVTAIETDLTKIKDNHLYHIEKDMATMAATMVALTTTVTSFIENADKKFAPISAWNVLKFVGAIIGAGVIGSFLTLILK